MTLAHIAGLPIEESLATVLPAAGMLAVFVGVRLRGLAALVRRRRSDKQTR